MNVLAAKFLSILKNIIFLAAFIYFFASCTVVKDYPAGKPFVYKTTVDIEGEYNTEEKKQLTERLLEQMDDSIRVRSVQKLVGWENGPKFFYSLIKNPASYDSVNADKSKIFMRALLNSLGYYRDSISYNDTVHIRGDQLRTTVNFDVTPSTLFKLDSIAFNISNDSLQSISQQQRDTLEAVTRQAIKSTLLQKGEAFSKPLLSAERDRLADMYRNNGYLLFSNDDLRVVWDTVGIALLRPTLDPIEQAQQLEALQRRRENPVADVEYRLKPSLDTAHLTRYYVGNVTVYPDLTPDTALFTPVVKKIRNSTIITYRNLFKSRVILENSYLIRGDLYSQRNYLKTLNRFNSLGAFRLVNIDPAPRPGTDTVDFIVKLTPADKYIFEGNIEGSQNWGNTSTLFTEGNLIGINLGLQNRNFLRGANLANTSFRYGVGLSNSRRVQTQQFSLSHVITFPRSIPRYQFLSPSLKENAKTSLIFNANYLDRKDFLALLTINAAWGYSFTWRNKLLTLRLPNIEYAFLERRKDLIELIKNNRSYQYIFNDGFVSSVIAGLTITGGKQKLTNVLRLNAEASGLLLGMLHTPFLDSNLKRFLRMDADFRQTYSFNNQRSAFAWRIFAGTSYPMPLFKTDSSNFSLPFFKSYTAGGANSMRAWSLRKLGPGSAIRSFGRTEAPDRFGDLQLELNAEYRFFLTEIGGVKINSALFTDMGNIWYLRKNTAFPDGEFRFDKLWKDLAIGAGTGLRVDFGLFLVRVDLAYKLKDPSPSKEDEDKQNKFFPYRKLSDAQIQLGVNYPF
jgi:outer membrane protein assembly factor BamA